MHEPVLPEDHDDEALAGYRAAYELMRSGSPSARQAFAAYVGRFAEDTLAAFHLGRLLAGEASAEVSIEG